jgi:hypothetical protein
MRRASWIFSQGWYCLILSLLPGGVSVPRWAAMGPHCGGPQLFQFYLLRLHLFDCFEIEAAVAILKGVKKKYLHLGELITIIEADAVAVAVGLGWFEPAG